MAMGVNDTDKRLYHKVGDNWEVHALEHSSRKALVFSNTAWHSSLPEHTVQIADVILMETGICIAHLTRRKEVQTKPAVLVRSFAEYIATLDEWEYNLIANCEMVGDKEDAVEIFQDNIIFS
eukprot:4177204-Ditylum_brightwellii.AAC.1